MCLYNEGTKLFFWGFKKPHTTKGLSVFWAAVYHYPPAAFVTAQVCVVWNRRRTTFQARAAGSGSSVLGCVGSSKLGTQEQPSLMDVTECAWEELCPV